MNRVTQQPTVAALATGSQEDLSPTGKRLTRSLYLYLVLDWIPKDQMLHISSSP